MYHVPCAVYQVPCTKYYVPCLAFHKQQNILPMSCPLTPMRYFWQQSVWWKTKVRMINGPLFLQIDKIVEILCWKICLLLPFEYNWSTFFSAAPFWLVLSILFEPPRTTHYVSFQLSFEKSVRKSQKTALHPQERFQSGAMGGGAGVWQMDCNECWLTWLPTLLLPIDRSGFLNSTKYLSPNSCCTNHTCLATSSQRQRGIHRHRHNHRQRQRQRYKKTKTQKNLYELIQRQRHIIMNSATLWMFVQGCCLKKGTCAYVWFLCRSPQRRLTRSHATLKTPTVPPEPHFTLATWPPWCTWYQVSPGTPGARYHARPGHATR